MSTWMKAKTSSDKYLPAIKKILGLHLIGEPPFEEDAERNTDLIVLRLEAVRIACRIRSYEKYYCKYPGEFTIRAKRPSGMKTELTKIIEGWGDYFFYGFGREDGTIAAWTLGKLHAFRLWHATYMYRNNGVAPGDGRENTDNSSTFRVYQIADVPDFIMAQSPAVEEETS